MEYTADPFDPGSFYSPNAAARRIRERGDAARAPCGPRFFRKYHASGELPAIKLTSGRLLFRGEDLNRFLAGMAAAPSTGPSRDRDSEVRARVDAQLRHEHSLANAEPSEPGAESSAGAPEVSARN